MSRDPFPDGTDLYVACPGCIEFVSISEYGEGGDALEYHNKLHHDGNTVIRELDTKDMNDLKALIREIKTHASTESYNTFIDQMRTGDVPFFCSATVFSEVVPHDDQ